MKHLKLFEKYNIGEPVLGDWVICKDMDYPINKELTSFINNNVGKIVSNNLSGYWVYWVKYYNIPDDLKICFRDSKMSMRRKDIKYWTIPTNKKELETILQANKYNL